MKYLFNNKKVKINFDSNHSSSSANFLIMSEDEKNVIGELYKAKIESMSADNIMVSGFQEAGIKRIKGLETLIFKHKELYFMYLENKD